MKDILRALLAALAGGSTSYYGELRRKEGEQSRAYEFDQEMDARLAQLGINRGQLDELRRHNQQLEGLQSTQELNDMLRFNRKMAQDKEQFSGELGYKKFNTELDYDLGRRGLNNRLEEARIYAGSRERVAGMRGSNDLLGRRLELLRKRRVDAENRVADHYKTSPWQPIDAKDTAESRARKAGDIEEERAARELGLSRDPVTGEYTLAPGTDASDAAPSAGVVERSSTTREERRGFTPTPTRRGRFNPNAGRQP